LVSSPASAGEETDGTVCQADFVFRIKYRSNAMKKGKAGFTLIELLVVVAIIALLLAILMPALNRAKDHAKRVVCANQLKQIGIAVNAYAGKYNGALPNVMPLSTSNPWQVETDPTKEDYHPFAAYRGGDDDPEYKYPDGTLVPLRLACLYEAHLIDMPKVFYCPSNKDKGRMYKSYVNPEPWGTLPQVYNTINNSNQWVRCGYEWFPIDRYPKVRSRPYQGRKVLEYTCRMYDRLDPYLPYCTDVSRTRDTMSHKFGRVVGMNLMYPDGSVVFCDDQNIFRKNLWDIDPSSKERELIMSVFYTRMLEFSTQ
jgi:prepilin-type N-terminal cleavage/methylation domain-containing protein